MSSAAASAPSDASNDIVLRRGAIALLALFALIYLLPLGVRPLSSPDEVRYGEIAREMIASGDWVSPHFNGVRYFEKPVLGHWLNAISVATLGESRFAVRLPVALATGLSGLIVFLLARRFISRSTAVLSSAIFLTTLIVAGCGSVAVLDAFLALFVTAAVAAYYVAVTAGTRRERYAYLALCGVACGAAFLTKGFIAWAIPAVVAAPYLIARRDLRTLLTSPWLPFGVAILVSLPWGVLVHLREPDFWRYFVIVEHLQRFAGDNAQHPQPPWFFVAYLPAIGWPWIWLLPAAAIGIRGEGRHKDFLFYAALWAVMPLLFFSASKGKLLTYVLPCFAPLSILLAAGLERYFAAGRTRAFRIAAGLAAVLLALLLVLLAVSQAGKLGAPAYGPDEHGKLAAMAALLAAALVCAVIAARSTGARTGLVAFTGTAVAFFLPLDVALPQRAIDGFAPSTAIAHYVATPADTVLVSDASLAGAVAWELNRQDVYVVNPGEMSYGLSYPEARHRKLTSAMLGDLIASSRGAHDMLVLCEPDTEKEIDSQLPTNTERSQDGRVRVLRIPR
jgi:4-amino-4-deoxy-L-arabinose transferase